MTNARSIIESAARKIHVLGRGQTLSAEQAESALEALNGFLGTFSAESATIYNNTRETFSLDGSQSYTIGSGGDFNTAAPIEITSAFVTDGSTDYPLRVVNSDTYARLADKTLEGTPDSLYYENNTPLGRLFIFPIGASFTLTLYSRKPLTEFANLTTEYDIPSGFKNMLVYNLAIHLCPEYEKPITPDLMMFAKQSKIAVSGAIRRTDYPTSQLDVGESEDGNILSGYYQ